MTVGPGPLPLDRRVPGQSVIAELLTVRQLDSPRSRLGRIFGADPLSADSRPWYLGALGEIDVGKLLARLGPGWTVLHAVPVGAGDSDIDHVAIGPAGVFTINTKHHEAKSVWVAGRTFMVAGQRKGHVRDSVHESARAGKLLAAAVGTAVPVAGVIVLVGAKNVNIRAAPTGTTVLMASQLVRWLGKRPVRLTDAEVASIAAAAILPGTWHRAPRDAGSAAEVQDGFSQVHEAVQAARRRRRRWGFVGMAAMLAATVALITAIPGVLESLVQAFIT